MGASTGGAVERELIVTGIGGHGVQLATQVLARAGRAAGGRCLRGPGRRSQSGLVHRTRRMLERAFRVQAGGGFALVEILTMCPTGWFVEVEEGPEYMQGSLGEVHAFGELKAPG
jgi:2-oxoglutarate/2-oxoacid ferredoxin oxidoreductase subunit beta